MTSQRPTIAWYHMRYIQSSQWTQEQAPLCPVVVLKRVDEVIQDNIRYHLYHYQSKAWYPICRILQWISTL